MKFRFLEMRLVLPFASILTFAFLLSSIGAQAQTLDNSAAVPAGPFASQPSPPPGFVNSPGGSLVPYDQAMKALKSRPAPTFTEPSSFLPAPAQQPDAKPLSSQPGTGVA